MSGKDTSTSNRKKSFSERIGKSSAVSSVLKLASDEEKEDYKAFGDAKNSSDNRPAFELRRNQGLFTGINYSNTKGYDADLAGKRETLLLYTDIGRIVIKGKHLFDLKEKYLSHALYWIALFDEDIHLTPPKGETIIDEIAIYDDKNDEKQEENSE